MKERSATLWVQTRWNPQGGGTVIFRPPDGAELLIEIPEVDRHKLDSELVGLREKLREAKNLFRSLEYQDWQKISEGFQILYDHGRLIALRLFNDRLRDVSELFRRLHPLWDKYRGEPLLMVVDGPLQGFIPFEFLPLFSTAPWKEIRDLESLIAMARRLVGFSFFVRRHLTGQGIPQYKVLENNPKLPVRFFHHAGLRGARKEAEFFRTRSRFVELRGPWPMEELEEAAVRSDLAGYLWDPCLPFEGTERYSPDQVQHFACHCDTEEENSEDGSLELSHDGKARRRVRIRDLELSLSEYLGGGSGDRPVMPLVFVNACASSVEDTRQMASFHRFFLHQNHNRGYIGTETRIPDSIASAFSKYFYSQLLTGSSLGTAIHTTRWKLLERHRNPLGLLYTVHADPEIRVQRPIS